MRLRVTHELPADPHVVARLLADPAYVDAKVRASGAHDRHVDVTGSTTEAFTVTTRRSLPTAQIPAHLAGLVGASIEVRQVEAWEAAAPDGARTGTVVVEIVGAPVRVTGRTALAPAGPGTTTLSYDGDVRAALPIFGAAVEAAAAQAVQTALDAEADVARERLTTSAPTASAASAADVPAAGGGEPEA